ncbi:MAG: alpha-mannosidase [Lentisphaeria bacterium]|nr:alpha-mannosidase [Lentisphaeria bacterium]
MKHEKINHIIFEHIRLFLQRHRDDFYGEFIPLSAVYALSDDPVPFAGRKDLIYKEISEGARWGSKWQSAWFELSGTVPGAWQGKEVVLQILFNSESMLFDDNGVPLYGFSGGSLFDNWFVRDYYHLGKVAGGEKFTFSVEAAANHLFGVNTEPEVDYPDVNFDAVVKKMRLVVFNRDVWDFLADMRLLFSVLKSLPAGDYRYSQLLRGLNDAVCIYQDMPENASKARAVLQKFLSYPAAASALTVHAVGHAHIDVGWLWPVKESIRKAARTFSTQLDLLEKYPEYIFGASQPQLYQFVKDHYPALFEKIKAQVKAGRWEPQGGMWVEADCNIAGGESLVRQFLHGKNFFMDEFGVDVKNLWLPDVFGYSAALPQIIRKSGCDFFLTQKLSWSQINKFPYETFWWQGVDGSRVLTHFLPEKNYNSDLLPEKLIAAQNNFAENSFLNRFISLFGMGDGGGGASPEYLENRRRQENLEYTPKVKCSGAGEFFELLKDDADSLDSWNGELYLEYHRGTYTTHAKIKRNNRKCEELLMAAEFMFSHLPAEKYPSEFLDKTWKKMLCNQFHDILPGSSITEVYRDAEADYIEIASGCRSELDSAAEELFVKDENSMVLVNSLSSEYSGVIELPETWNGFRLTDENGETLPVQQEGGKLLTSVSLPGTSFSVIRRKENIEENQIFRGNELFLENSFIRYEFSETGLLISAVDKESGREFISAPGNLLSIYHDRSNYFEAWDIDIFYMQEKNADLAGEFCGSFTGPVRSGLEFNFRYGKSTIRQVITLTPQSRRLDFETSVLWHESRRMLRTSFPLTVQSPEALFDIQYGYIRRATHNNTSWETAQFEVCAHKFADLSDAAGGAALLNDCKYGYRVKGNIIDMALLRSPKHPDFYADMGEHTFTYSFYPHNDGMTASGVQESAAALNRVPLSFPGFALPEISSLIRIDGKGVVLSALKKAEKEDACVIRLVENKGEFSKITLELSDKDAILVESNLIEWENGAELRTANGRVELKFSPFEIRTFKLKRH